MKAKHQDLVGCKVTVKGETADGHRFTEGDAHIIKIIDEDANRYFAKVEFVNDKGVPEGFMYYRWIWKAAVRGN